MSDVEKTPVYTDPNVRIRMSFKQGIFVSGRRIRIQIRVSLFILSLFVIYSLKMSNISEIKPEIGLCDGCLSTDRALAPLGNFSNLYLKLIGLRRKNRLQVLSLMMCWECMRMFEKIEKFKRKISQAQQLLSNCVDGNITKYQYISLSSITTIVKTNYDYEFISGQDNDNFELNDVDLKDEDCYPHDYEEVTEPKCDRKIEIEIDKQDIKEEIDEFDEINYDNDDVRADIKQENDHYSELHNKIRQTKKAYYLETKKMDYKVIQNTKSYIKNDERYYYKKATINHSELLEWLKKLTRLKTFVTRKYKCKTCIRGFMSDDKLMKHFEKFHSQTNEFVCDICSARLPTRAELIPHVKEHYKIYECLVCGKGMYRLWEVFHHFKVYHKNTYQCLRCEYKTENKWIFYRHFKSIHQRFICDYCGKIARMRHTMVRHIKLHHSEHRCHLCSISFKTYRTLEDHMRRQHVVKETEDSYCVECDIQFPNVDKFRRHLRTSVKHKPPKKLTIPCPICNKTYAKTSTMMNHYRLVHLQQTKYYCEECDRYFLNGYRYRQHKASTHDKVQKPRNKICSHCGQGFFTNRILENHVRTHTGERPFACTHCSASFGQKAALMSHLKSIHKVVNQKQNVINILAGNTDLSVIS